MQPVPPDLRLSLTAGLAGRIVETGQPATTTDYLADASITHLPQADSFAGAEGLRSLLGVPLHARGRTLGVLFAAERTVRSFSDAEVRLLAGLAAQAAVAVDDAELVEAERAAAAELREANARLRDQAAAVDRAVVRRTLGDLLEHDAAKGTDLARTLEGYLASGRQHTATAEALHIHPNTLYQRLGRITTVLGEDWRQADRALDLHVALRLHRLAAAL